MKSNIDAICRKDIVGSSQRSFLFDLFRIELIVTLGTSLGFEVPLLEEPGAFEVILMI